MKIDNELLKHLYQKLSDAKESRDLFNELGDYNMAKAWTEQIEFITTKIKKEMQNEYGSK